MGYADAETWDPFGRDDPEGFSFDPEFSASVDEYQQASWFDWFGGGSSVVEEVGETARTYLHEVGETARTYLGEAGNTVRSLGDDAATTVQTGYREAGSTLRSTAEDVTDVVNPVNLAGLSFGAVLAVAAVSVGGLLVLDQVFLGGGLLRGAGRRMGAP